MPANQWNPCSCGTCLRIVNFALAVITVLASTATAGAWGCSGHHIVALIAEQHLSAKAFEATGRLLPPNRSIESSPGIARTKRPARLSVPQLGRMM